MNLAVSLSGALKETELLNLINNCQSTIRFLIMFTIKSFLYLVFLINCYNSWHFFVDREENKDLRFLVCVIGFGLFYLNLLHTICLAHLDK